MEKQIELLNEEKRQQSQSLEDTRVNLAKTESQRDEAITRFTELKETVTELRQENRNIRDHFEHYQQRTAEDRQQERDQFRATNQQLHDQVHNLQGQLTQAASRESGLSDANAKLQRAVDELEQTNASLSSEVSRKIEDIQSLTRNAEEASKGMREYQHKNDELTEKVAVITSMKAEAEKNVAVLSQALEDANTRLKASQDKVELLSDENKVILLEKAVIQGQFKQLQSSLP